MASSPGSKAYTVLSGTEKSDPAEDFDYFDKPELYFTNLEKLKLHAENIQKIELNEEKALMEFLPVNEKFSFNKEGKVLTRWQERKRDWDRIQAQIQRKINSKIKKPLMMSTTDEFRAKLEELDLVQASIPIEERYNETTWQTQLRGGGAIRVSVGHIFSGLECEYETKPPNPKLVRKPKPSEFIGKNDTFVDQTSTYLLTKKKFDKNYRDMRPHDVAYSDANNLVIRSTNLFKWAKDSSEDYFNKNDYQTLNVLNESINNQASMLSLGGNSEAKSSDAIGSSIQFLSSKEISFDAMIGKSCTKTVEFRNNGTISLLYKWRLLTQESIEASKEAQVDKSRITIITEQRPGTAGDKSTLKEILAGKGMNELSSIRSHVITQHRDSFFCCKDVGEVLPDEVVSTTFIFNSRAGGGSFTSQWILEFIPDNTTILQTYHMNQNQVAPSVGFMVCNLHGYCYSEDESIAKRNFVSNYIEQSSINAMAKDIVFNCLRRVRDPVRLKDIHHRQNELFRIINKDLLLMINNKYTSAIPIFITPARLDKFCEIYNQASQVFINVTSTLVNLQNKRKLWMTKDEISQQNLIFKRINDNPLVMNLNAIEQIKSKLFPEQVIDVFDEITEDQYFPHWNYDISTILSCMTELLPQAEKVSELESEINILEAIDLKMKLKAQRKTERIAALDSDEEYEEEEEEVEEEEEETEKPIHPYIIEVQSVISSVYSGINLLVIHPLPSDAIYKIANEIIIDIADLIVNSHENSLQQANIADIVNTQGGTIPTIPSPFTSSEGEEQWKDILNAQVAVTEVDPKLKGGKTAAKPTKGALVVTNTELSKEQVNAFYKAMYDEVRNSLLNVTLNMFSKINEYLVQSNQMSYKEYKTSKDNLFDISVPRKSDLTSVYSGKVAFLSWNGSAFNELQSTIKSAFNVKQSNKESAIKPIMKLIEYEAQAIVLFYEPNLTNISLNDNSVSILLSFDEIKALIEQKYEEYIIQNNKILKKNKVKPGFYKQLSFSKYKSFAEFYYHMSQLLNRSDYEVYFSEYLPIIMLETISNPGVVPIEPSYEEVVSDDDDAPVNIGIAESILQKHKKFELKRPYRVKVPVEIIKKSSSNKVSNNNTLVEIECYADTVSAISEAYFMKPNSKPFDVMWMEACPNKLFDPNSSFESLNINGRHVSEEIREMILWCGIFQTIQNIPLYLTLEEESESKQILNNDRDNDISINIMHSMYQNDSSEKSNIKAHIINLFPYSAKSKEVPNALGIIAGHIRADKFCVLDQLIDSVDTIYLAGEMALAFISLSKRLVFKKYTTELNKYTDACIAIISKARMKGCTLILPIDLLCGEEKINIEDKMKCYNKFELDSRNEGSEYESDTKVYDVHELNEIKIIDGYAYDIGPKSCQILKDILIKTELLLVWGTIGVSEVSTFQNGQQVLVDHSINKVDDNKDHNKDILLRNPLHTILFGDTTVEWYTRMIDTDGELNGDLVSAGIVTYLHRDSTLLAGIMGLFHSSIIQNKLKFRPCNDYEWIYSSKKVELEEEEDDEDEDD